MYEWKETTWKRICNDFPDSTKRKHSQCFEWSHEIRFYMLGFWFVLLSWDKCESDEDRYLCRFFPYHLKSITIVLCLLILTRSTARQNLSLHYRRVFNSIYNKNIFFSLLALFSPLLHFRAVVYKFIALSQQHSHAPCTILSVQFTHNQFKTFWKWIKFIQQQQTDSW